MSSENQTTSISEVELFDFDNYTVENDILGLEHKLISHEAAETQLYSLLSERAQVLFGKTYSYYYRHEKLWSKGFYEPVVDIFSKPLLKQEEFQSRTVAEVGAMKLVEEQMYGAPSGSIFMIFSPSSKGYGSEDKVDTMITLGVKDGWHLQCLPVTVPETDAQSSFENTRQLVQKLDPVLYQDVQTPEDIISKPLFRILEEPETISDPHTKLLHVFKNIDSLLLEIHGESSPFGQLRLHESQKRQKVLEKTWQVLKDKGFIDSYLGKLELEHDPLGTYNALEKFNIILNIQDKLSEDYALGQPIQGFRRTVEAILLDEFTATPENHTGNEVGGVSLLDFSEDQINSFKKKALEYDQEEHERLQKPSKPVIPMEFFEIYPVQQNSDILPAENVSNEPSLFDFQQLFIPPIIFTPTVQVYDNLEKLFETAPEEPYVEAVIPTAEPTTLPLNAASNLPAAEVRESVISSQIDTDISTVPQVRNQADETQNQIFELTHVGVNIFLQLSGEGDDAVKTDFGEIHEVASQATKPEQNKTVRVRNQEITNNQAGPAVSEYQGTSSTQFAFDVSQSSNFQMEQPSEVSRNLHVDLSGVVRSEQQPVDVQTLLSPVIIASMVDQYIHTDETLAPNTNSSVVAENKSEQAGSLSSQQEFRIHQNTSNRHEARAQRSVSEKRESIEGQLTSTHSVTFNDITGIKNSLEINTLTSSLLQKAVEKKSEKNEVRQKREVAYEKTTGIEFTKTQNSTLKTSIHEKEQTRSIELKSVERAGLKKKNTFSLLEPKIITKKNHSQVSAKQAALYAHDSYETTAYTASPPRSVTETKATGNKQTAQFSEKKRDQKKQTLQAHVEISDDTSFFNLFSLESQREMQVLLGRLMPVEKTQLLRSIQALSNIAQNPGTGNILVQLPEAILPIIQNAGFEVELNVHHAGYYKIRNYCKITA